METVLIKTNIPIKVGKDRKVSGTTVDKEQLNQILNVFYGEVDATIDIDATEFDLYTSREATIKEIDLVVAKLEKQNKLPIVLSIVDQAEQNLLNLKKDHHNPNQKIKDTIEQYEKLIGNSYIFKIISSDFKYIRRLDDIFTLINNYSDDEQFLTKQEIKHIYENEVYKALSDPFGIVDTYKYVTRPELQKWIDAYQIENPNIGDNRKTPLRAYSMYALVTECDKVLRKDCNPHTLYHIIHTINLQLRISPKCDLPDEDLVECKEAITSSLEAYSEVDADIKTKRKVFVLEPEQEVRYIYNEPEETANN